MLIPPQVEGSAYRFPRGWTLTRRVSYESNATNATASSSAVPLRENTRSQSTQAKPNNATDDLGFVIEPDRSLQAGNHHLF